MNCPLIYFDVANRKKEKRNLLYPCITEVKVFENIVLAVLPMRFLLKCSNIVASNVFETFDSTNLTSSKFDIRTLFRMQSIYFGKN